MAEDITIVVSEVDNAGRFSAHVDGRYILTSPSPFCDAARALVAQGADPQSILTMKHAGSETVALSAILGDAAELRVTTNTTGSPVFERYRKPLPTTAGGLPVSYSSA